VSASDESWLHGGTAGASARREHERRRANRERRVRERNPRTASLRLAFATPPGHETVWARGAAGEERVAELLAKHLDDDVVVLHDRRIPLSRANIDHIAVARSGVWVIDAKRYNGKASVSRPLFGAAKLTIAGRDRSRLVEGLARQVELVEAIVEQLAPAVAVRGALCFVDTELPVLKALTFKGFPLLHAKPLAKRINAGGPHSAQELQLLAAEIGRRLPPATG
jgi:Nuclease-related domain